MRYSRLRDRPTALREIGAEAVIVDALDAAAVKAAVGRIRPDAVINEYLTASALHARRNEGSGGTRSQSPSGRQR